MFKPSKGRILVEADPPSKETSFGLLLPENKERPATGTVIVGNEDVKTGDKILFSLYGIDEFKHEGKNYTVVSDKGVLGIFQ